MVANRTDPPRPGGDPGKAPAPAPDPAAADAAATQAKAKAGGGLGPWIPLVVAVVLMPVLAFALTSFVLVPKLQRAVSGDNAEHAAASAPKAASKAAASSHGGAPESGGHGEKGAVKEAKKKHVKGEASAKKVTAAMKKVLVNVSGTQGTRFLMVSMTLAGSTEEFKVQVEENMDQLTDLASTALGSKTIADLEKPGARNLIRAELLAVFNSVLGSDAVNEIYFTEFAIQ